MKKNINMLLILCILCNAHGQEIDEKDIEEARGKGKYALLTHLSIVLAAKLGLAKIILGIAFVLAAMKAMVVMAWALAIFKYVPDYWPHYQSRPVSFFYVVASKLLVLKVVYGIIFYILISKAWHFVVWLLHYLKHKPHDHYVEYDHEPYHAHHDYHEHGFEKEYDHEPYGTYGGSDKLGYKTDYAGKRNKFYDADGSYSVARS